MALYRSKLGPVGGGGEDGTGEGGVLVDLDPLSAFVLMGGGGDEHDGAASNADGKPAVAASGVGSRSKNDHNTSPVLSQRRSTGKLSGAAAPRPITDKKTPAFSTQPFVTPRDALEIAGYPGPTSGVPMRPFTPSSRKLERLSSAGRTPSPPKQLRALDKESSLLNSFKPGGMASGIPMFEDGATLESSAEKIDPLEILKNEGIECLEGELLLVKLQNASFEGLHGKMVPGVLIMTTYKLLLIPHRLAQRGAHIQGASSGADERYAPFGHLPKEYVQVPMTYIDRVERDSDRKGAPRVERYFNGDAAVTIHCKDARRIRVSFGGPEESERAMKMLQQLAFPGLQMEHLFAFSHRTVDAGLPDPGWYIYDPRKEFDRMGVLKPRRNSASPWRLCDLNKNYAMCASYPSLLVVPASVTDVEIEAVSQFRSEQRLPVLCWGRQADSASIWRSSQPKIGISRATCFEDEQMLGRLAATSPSRILPIVDCRPRSNATANFAAGYGYESYADCPLEFSGIGNIHVMRESLAKLENLCLSGTARDQDWSAVVEDTRWLSHVRAVLTSAWTVAYKAHTQRAPVLVHCSHGWDRTSQVCSLAQMLLDPYYRTMDGFQVLIEKDWLAFGHPFHLRHAYGLPRGVTSGKEDQRSPIFLQFLDCVWQLVMQLPSYFEFNPRYLLCIADHIQSSRFGTFLCNTNKARREAKLEERCGSLWTFLELHRSSFLSRLYHRDPQEELLPPLPSLLRHVRLWGDYFLRWSPAPSFVALPAPLRDGDTGSSIVDGSRVASDESGAPNGGGVHSEDLRGGRSESEQSHSTAIPVFRCEFDEMERWVDLYGREADRWRRKALGIHDDGAAKPVSRPAGEGAPVPGSTRAEADNLVMALEEIKKLRAALAEKEELVRELRVSADLGKPTALTPTPKVYETPCTPIVRHANHAADTIAGETSANRPLGAAEAPADSAELEDDGKIGW